MIQTKTKKKRIPLYTAAFLMPLVSLTVIFIIYGIAPFGDNTLAFSDAHNQYISFFKYYRDLLLGKQDAFYSLEKTLGGSMAGLYAYYLASPFNLIFILFNEYDILIAFDIMIAIKLSCCGLTAAYFFDSKNQLNTQTLIFTTSYALCGYNVAFCWSTMWIDAVILLPLVAAGIIKICNNEPPLLYIAALSLSIITSFYMGFILCIFSVIYFLYLEYIDGRLHLCAVRCFVLSSLVSGGISSFILIPAIMSFSGGKRQSGFTIMWSMLERVYNYVLEKIVPVKQDKFTQYMRPAMIFGLICFTVLLILILYMILSEKIKKKKVFIPVAVACALAFFGFYFVIEQYIQGQNDILTKMLFGPVNYDEVFNGHPNIYAGEFALLLSVSYFGCRKISAHERRGSVAFCLILVLSLALYIPNLIWHGFTKNACFNFRYSFILSFFLITLAAEAVDKIGTIEVLWSVVGLFAIVVFSLIKRPTYVQNWQYVYEIIVCVLTAGAILFLLKHKSVVSIIVLMVVGILPILIATSASMKNESEEAIRNSYYKMVFESGSKVIDRIKNDDGLFRIRKEGKWLNLNDPMTFIYNGVSHYSSTEKASTIEYLDEIGVVTYQNIWASVDESMDDSNDDDLGIKYIVKENGEVEINNDYRPIVSLSGEGECSVEVKKDSLFRIETKCDAPQSLIITVPHEKGWRAIVNGQKMELLKTETIFMFLPLEAGENSIELSFTPPGLIPGTILTLASLVLVYTLSRRKRY